MIRDDLGRRMKEFYEEVSRTKLVKKIPVAIRIDGKAFHTFTKNFVKPFDSILVDTMQRTMQYLCANIQGCVFGYTQSDEITLILQDFKTPTTSAWFDYEVQKMCSIASSMATMKFNEIFAENIQNFILKNSEEISLYKVYNKAKKQGAMFDARVFNIPLDEVCNLIYWRQLDATRNSISMVARTYFEQKDLYKKTSNEMQDMLMINYDVDWTDYPTYLKRGTSCYKKAYERNGVIRHEWYIDKNMPIIIEDREYIENTLKF